MHHHAGAPAYQSWRAKATCGLLQLQKWTSGPCSRSRTEKDVTLLRSLMRMPGPGKATGSAGGDI